VGFYFFLLRIRLNAAPRRGENCVLSGVRDGFLVRATKNLEMLTELASADRQVNEVLIKLSDFKSWSNGGLFDMCVLAAVLKSAATVNLLAFSNNVPPPGIDRSSGLRSEEPIL